MINAIPYLAFAAPLVSVGLAFAIYVRKRKLSPDTIWSALLFAVGVFATGVAIAYLAYVSLTWAFCYWLPYEIGWPPFYQERSAAICGMSPYFSPLLGFAVGALGFALLWQLIWARPRSKDGARDRGRATGANAQASTERPRLVYAIFFYYLIVAIFTALASYFLWSYAGSLPSEQGTYYPNLSALDWAFVVLSATLNFAGAISLFLLRRFAVHFFTANIAISALYTLASAIKTNWIAALGGTGAIGELVGYAILLGACVYSWKLRVRGVLA